MGTTYFYYRCTNLNCKSHKSFNVILVHQEIEKFLKTLIIEEPILKCFEFAIKEEYNTANQFTEKEEQDIKQKLKTIDKQCNELLQSMLNEKVEETKVIYREKLTELGKEKELLKAKLTNISESTQNIDINQLLQKILPILQNPYKLWVE
jgi:membrane-anchored protein YejM (alkaline phosphatase superfamily)